MEPEWGQEKDIAWSEQSLVRMSRSQTGIIKFLEYVDM
jgi:hypothetical protein